MRNKRHTPEQIIAKLREAEVALSQGARVPEISRKLGVTEQTCYRWRKEFGGLKVDQAKRLKVLEKENTRLRKAVSDLTLDNQILKEVSSGNF
jgi:transposase-like protein